MLIGSHVGFKAPKMLLGSAEEAVSYGSSTFMLYTGAPQNTRRKPLEELNIEKGTAYIKEHNLTNIVVHAPYIVNLANPTKPDKFAFGVEFLTEEVRRSAALGATEITLHPGSHVGAGEEAGIESLVKGLNEVLTSNEGPQTLAGKGNEVGITFEQIAKMIDGITYNDRVAVTFDTCHTSDAGYNIKDDFDGVLNEFDHIIGVDRLKVLHLNDSKNPQGSHKDRHANIGMGHIGFDALNHIAHHPQLENVPKILETPYVPVDDKNKVAPYKEEIAMIKAGQFNEKFIDEIVNNAK